MMYISIYKISHRVICWRRACDGSQSPFLYDSFQPAECQDGKTWYRASATVSNAAMDEKWSYGFPAAAEWWKKNPCGKPWASPWTTKPYWMALGLPHHRHSSLQRNRVEGLLQQKEAANPRRIGMWPTSKKFRRSLRRLRIFEVQIRAGHANLWAQTGWHGQGSEIIDSPKKNNEWFFQHVLKKICVIKNVVTLIRPSNGKPSHPRPSPTGGASSGPSPNHT